MLSRSRTSVVRPGRGCECGSKESATVLGATSEADARTTVPVQRQSRRLHGSVEEVKVCQHQDVWLEEATVNHHAVQMKIDSGAKGSVMSVAQLDILRISMKK